MEIKTVGIDLAKNVFELFGVNEKGKAVYRRRVRREKLMEAIAQLPPCVIGIEACTGAFYWQREFQRFGHTVKVISPQYVKPFVKSQKNDGNDAEAICIAVQQPQMRFVPCKTVEQQDIQALHRARQRIVNHRTAVVCQIRGLLLDRGIAIGTGITRARTMIPLILEDAENGLTGLLREALFELYDLLRDLDARVDRFDQRIDAVFRASSTCQRIAKIKGVGPKTATAIVAAIGDGSDFKNGRHFSAWLGLVPRQYSSGDRRLMLGISKRGNQALRTVLVHGGRSVVRSAVNKEDPLSVWVNQIRERRGFNKAAVAVANKNARIIWAVLRHDEPYRGAA
jgi:transposase